MSSKSTKKNKAYFLCLFVCVIIGIVFIILNFFVAFGHESFDIACIFVIVFLLISTFFFSIYGFVAQAIDKKFDIKTAGAILWIFVGFSMFYTFWDRGEAETRLKWECEGRVIKKYQGYKGADTIEIDGDITEVFSGIDPDFYKLVKVGDSVKKIKWSAFATVNGQNQRIVGQYYCSWPRYHKMNSNELLKKDM